MQMRRVIILMLGLILAPAVSHAAPSEAEKRAVIKTYADIAEATCSDSLATARKLQRTIDAFLTRPSAASLQSAKAAWLAARVPYMQSEAFRFGNKIVDDWEGKVNAWPLDEGLIDYVDLSYGKSSKENPLFTANIVASRSLTVAGKTVDVRKITKALLSSVLHEGGGVEANVATGYHAIEFLLWGQDLNGTGRGAGKRAWTDFSVEKCTIGHCERRRAYLKVATGLLVDDLAWMVAQWSAKGAARVGLTKGDADKGIAAIITGIGSLSYGELAGERMKLGLMLHDPEEEHDCFSDNTHNSHFYDVVGISNVYFGRYKRIDGSTVKGPSLAALVRKVSPVAAKAMEARLATTRAAFTTLKQRAEKVEAYDQMIAEKNKKGNAVVQAAIDALVAQTKALEQAVKALGLKPIAFEGSDSLDDPSKVFK